jgi:hypothetical protein
MSYIENEFRASTFTAGRFWVTDGDASIDLGQCDTYLELLEAVEQVESQGDDNTDWSDWSVCQG